MLSSQVVAEAESFEAKSSALASLARSVESIRANASDVRCGESSELRKLLGTMKEATALRDGWETKKKKKMWVSTWLARGAVSKEAKALARTLDGQLLDVTRSSKDVLGRGVFGSTRKVVDDEDGVVRVKRSVRLAEARDLGGADVDAIRREVDVLVDLDHHPNVADHLRRIDEANGDLGLLVEFVQGALLKDRLAEAEAVPWLTQIGDALAHIHSRGVAHGNLTSYTVIVTEGDHLKLVALGLASVPSFVSKERQAYAPPEKKDMSHAADLWSLGCVAVELVTRRALGPEGPDLAACRARDAHGVSGLVGRLLLQRDPSDRASAVRFVAALGQARSAGGQDFEQHDGEDDDDFEQQTQTTTRGGGGTTTLITLEAAEHKEDDDDDEVFRSSNGVVHATAVAAGGGDEVMMEDDESLRTFVAEAGLRTDDCVSREALRSRAAAARALGGGVPDDGDSARSLPRYGVALRMPRDVAQSAEVFYETKQSSILKVLGTSQVEAETSLRYVDRGWQDDCQLKSEFVFGLRERRLGLVARAQSKREASLLAAAFRAVGFRAWASPHFATQNPATPPAPQRPLTDFLKPALTLKEGCFSHLDLAVVAADHPGGPQTSTLGVRLPLELRSSADIFETTLNRLAPSLEAVLLCPVDNDDDVKNDALWCDWPARGFEDRVHFLTVFYMTAVVDGVGLVARRLTNREAHVLKNRLCMLGTYFDDDSLAVYGPGEFPFDGDGIMAEGTPLMDAVAGLFEKKHRRRHQETTTSMTTTSTTTTTTTRPRGGTPPGEEDAKEDDDDEFKGKGDDKDDDSASSPKKKEEDGRPPEEPPTTVALEMPSGEELRSIFEFGRLSGPSPRRYLTRAAARLIATNGVVFSQSIPAYVLNVPLGQTTNYETRLREVISTFEGRSNWNFSGALAKLRGGEEEGAEETPLEAIFASLPEVDDDDKAVIEHVWICVRELKAAGLHFNLDLSLRQYATDHRKMFRAFATSILRGPEDDRWPGILGGVLPKLESEGWELTRAVTLMRDGERDLGALTDHADPRSAAIIEAIFRLVVSGGGGPSEKVVEDAAYPKPLAEAAIAAEHALRTRAADGRYEPPNSEVPADDPAFFEFGRVRDDTHASMTPRVLELVHKCPAIFFSDLPAFILAGNTKTTTKDAKVESLLTDLETSGWIVRFAVTRMKLDANRDLDDLTGVCDDNETALVEHLLVTVMQLEKEGLHFNVTKTTRDAIVDNDADLACLRDYATDPAKDDDWQPARDAANALAAKGWWNIKDAAKAIKQGETDIYQLVKDCDNNVASFIEHLLKTTTTTTTERAPNEDPQTDD
mmetsp:Transcript_7900/g.25935  ORF Transcript_7900/g.25935 Transcript_7900/m.25935 type:complete len:1320 (-) Transcript_7900:55-4014(-)|eukprot:CAMPEP_0118913962 /NCGR_PEP_ID=MMETSP1166-20130328/14523_1 /TAXON_ID=1104430 /ORGANISM="Chrysoreinhardia sp, Strain CCMP3193" /LENGTH=1319 /DNA_ID=CAMNT_0006853527 /DNA_START=131 /DNA_END=4090 /DNA_ORIENTATION=+